MPQLDKITIWKWTYLMNNSHSKWLINDDKIPIDYGVISRAMIWFGIVSSFIANNPHLESLLK